MTDLMECKKVKIKNLKQHKGLFYKELKLIETVKNTLKLMFLGG